MRLPIALHNVGVALKQRLALPVSLDLHVVSRLFARLSPREQRYVMVAAAVFCGALCYFLLIDPLWQMQRDLRARVAAKERELREIVALRQEYLTAKAEIERAHTGGGANFSPVGFLENLVRDVVGQEKVTAITPTAEDNQSGASLATIELKLSGVSLREIVEL